MGSHIPNQWKVLRCKNTWGLFRWDSPEVLKMSRIMSRCSSSVWEKISVYGVLVPILPWFILCAHHWSAVSFAAVIKATSSYEDKPPSSTWYHRHFSTSRSVWGAHRGGKALHCGFIKTISKQLTIQWVLAVHHLGGLVGHVMAWWGAELVLVVWLFRGYYGVVISWCGFVSVGARKGQWP